MPSLHFAVAPVGSVLLTASVGADWVADDVFAIVPAGDMVAEGAAALGAAVVAAGAGAAASCGAVVAALGAAGAGADFGAFCTPPCPLHAPRPDVMVVVPSLQMLGVDAAASAGAAVAGLPAAGTAAVALDSFFTPPCPLHAPRPEAVDVVPSLQVLASLESAACDGSPKMNAINGAAIRPIRFVLFMVM